MKTILIIYWSQTGNTEAMAHAIAQGVEEEGNQAKLLEVSEAEPEILKKAGVFALGCPAMGGEVLGDIISSPLILEAAPYYEHYAVFHLQAPHNDVLLYLHLNVQGHLPPDRYHLFHDTGWYHRYCAAYGA